MRWAPDARMAEPKQEIEVQTMLQKAHIRSWGENRSMLAFLERYYPNVVDDPSGRVAADIRTCRGRANVHTHDSRFNDARLVSTVGCGHKPYCPGCNNKGQRIRAGNAFKVLRALSPGEEMPRMLAVTVAPIHKTGEERPRWRREVTRDNARFAKAIYHEVVERMYGENVPAFGSFQPYGQALFAYRHPHVHFTVGGWRLGEDGKPTETGYYDMSQRGGLNALRRPLAEALEREFGSDCRFAHDQFSIRIDYSRYDEPTRPFRKTDRWVNYQYRELVDITAMKYDRNAETVTVVPYDKKVEQVVFPVMEWMAALTRYEKEFGGWKGKGKPPFHHRYGIASDRLANQAAEVFGNVHEDGCICGKCQTWNRPFHLQDDTEHRLDPMNFEWD